MRDRSTNRWAGVDAVAWGAAAVGLLAREPAVLLLAAVGVAFAAYARLGAPPRPDLRLTREVDDAEPEPGQEVTVRLGLENAGGRTLPDVRVVDGVPGGLAVLDGSPHVGTVLRPGETRIHTYSVRAERGTHAFDPVTVVCRSVNGAHEVEFREAVETAITCKPVMRGVAEPPLRNLVSPYGGQTPTSVGGSGVEFHGTREYRPGDSVRRIDWARLARTGELTTVELREERSATVVLLVDARRPAYVRPGDDPAAVHAVEWSVRAAADAFAGLLDAGHRVGVAALGRELAWLGTGTGEEHRRRARELLATHPALSPSPPRERWWSPRLTVPSPGARYERDAQLRRLRAQLPVAAQVVFLTPLADDDAAAIASRLQAGGHAVTTISPDVVGGGTPGARLARLGRARRVRTLRRADVRVVDWRQGDPLPVALARAQEAWR